MKLTNSHPILTTSADVREIVKPLNKLGINFFGYKRCYRDGSRFYLSTSPDFMQHYFHKRYHSIANTEKYPTEVEPRIALWSTVGQPDIYHDVRERFDMDHGLYLIKPSNHYFELFSFATGSDNQNIVNTYLSKFEYFLSFTDYFRDQSQSIITLAEKSKMTTPIRHYNLGVPYDKSDVAVSIQQLTMSKLSALLSPRQLECATYLLKGMTTDQIADLTQLSPRTVEFYLSNIKKKLGCKNRPQLIIKLMENLS